MEIEVNLSGWSIVGEDLWGGEVYTIRKVEEVQRLLSQGKIRLPKENVCPMQNLLHQCDRYQMQNDSLARSISTKVGNMTYNRRDFGGSTPFPKNNLNRIKFPKLYHGNSLLTAWGYHYDDKFWERD